MRLAADPQDLTVTCPRCGQRPGQRCISHSAGAAPTHIARKRAAREVAGA